MLKKLTVLLALVTTPVHAEDKQKLYPVDLTPTMMGLDGQPFKDCRRSDDAGKCVETVNLTLGRLCAIAASLPDRGASTTEQVLHGALALRLASSVSADLTFDEIGFLKLQFGKLGYNTMIVAQAVKLIEPPATDR
jgi:hypothetical protein